VAEAPLRRCGGATVDADRPRASAVRARFRAHAGAATWLMLLGVGPLIGTMTYVQYGLRACP
jgi:hypothetical protein